jgi:hypothetical protein
MSLHYDCESHGVVHVQAVWSGQSRRFDVLGLFTICLGQVFCFLFHRRYVPLKRSREIEVDLHDIFSRST